MKELMSMYVCVYKRECVRGVHGRERVWVWELRVKTIRETEKR